MVFIIISMERKLAATVKLVVKVFFSDYFVSALLEAAATPVLRPPCNPAHLRAGPFAGLVHLLQALPPGRSQGGSEHVEAIVPGVLGSA